MGLSEHVREAYGFICNNFDPHSQAELISGKGDLDEIVLMGFSRGAFTARAISSLISDVGLLTHVGMEYFWGIFGDWMKQNVKGKESEWFQSEFGKKVKFTAPEYRQTLIDNGYTRWPVPIRAVGVWDTVGSLGIPLPWKQQNVKEYSFVNSKVAQQVQHAFHAIALDEHRNLFSPTLWEKPDLPNNLRTLKQCWFPGVHSNIGGSYPDAGISNITLAWMISQLEETDGGILSFDHSYIDWLQDQNMKFYAKSKEPARPWGLGKLYDSAPVTNPMGLLQGLNPITRTPGRYDVVSDETGQQTKTRLTDTHETIHSSVRIRIVDNGEPPAEAPGPKYESAALKNYVLVQPISVQKETDHAREGNNGVYWKAKDELGDLLEEPLLKTEIRLLKRSIQISGKETHH
ncbi:hypothetical protein BGZ60DRAFT_408772 [Tricladium varicosporioides]|nr:hypothetical protein BGZ60DRAFT_408772 [Hymenoscyphus varicosporioides]